MQGAKMRQDLQIIPGSFIAHYHTSLFPLPSGKSNSSYLS